MPTLQPAAILLDFDGTLVDTEQYWMQGEIDLLGPMGVPWTWEQATTLCGTSKEYSRSVLLAQAAAYGVDVDAIDKEQFYAQLCGLVVNSIETRGAPWLPGVPEMLADLKAHDVPCAVVSASPAVVLEAGLKSFPPGVISVVVDGQAAPKGKPEPDGYLLAARLLGVDAADCVVIEDTASGTAAGRAAGAVVVAVPLENPLPDVPGQVQLKNLEGVDYARLCQIFTQARGQS